MTRFLALTTFSRPGLHVWREGSGLKLYLEPLHEDGLPEGFSAFECELGADAPGNVRCLLFEWNEDGTDQTAWEQSAHIHDVPRAPVVWLFHGAARAVAADPFSLERDSVRIHLVTAARYIHADLFLWGGRTVAPTGHDESGPFYDVPLAGRDRSFFQFKFRRPDGRYEPDSANRVWVAQDGAEIWTHSEGRDVLASPPVRRQIIVHFRQEIDASHPARMHLWQEGSDFETDVSGEAEAGGWTAYRALLYRGLPYRFLFFNPTLSSGQWEHPEARREVAIDDDAERWTLEGDHHVFAGEPQRNCRVNLSVAAAPPGYEVAEPLAVEAWVNRARAPLPPEPWLTFLTYPEVVTSFRLRGERIDRHTVTAQPGVRTGWIVPGRPPLLAAAPPVNQFADPPFEIRRPGAYEEDGFLRFVLHAPFAAQVELAGDLRATMRSTRDGAYWWAQVPLDGSDYHRKRYHFVLNGGEHVQDPAAGWVEGSSRLVARSAFDWHDGGWRTPAWDWLRLYQVHPSRFSRRGPENGTPLDRVAWEVEHGYLRDLHVTALQLMPVNEVGTTNSWGYDPGFFYAVEQGYGGPDALKRLVDTCHRRGIAVLLDVVFNHAGTSDNSLWPVARGTFFDGDTAWGAMINYDHPQVVHFFEQNVVYLIEEYHVDGFRFDFTRVIIHGHKSGEAHVREPGSGGGWEFLHRIRSAALRANPGCILIAEHLPNEWGVTNFGGPMDSQWCDDFHDRLKDACSGNPWVMSSLANALKPPAQEWYNATIYAESHDEVGNENGRLAHVGGMGRGWRMAKVGAAAVLMGRGIPMMFMGAESGEHRQFFNGSSEALDLEAYIADERRGRIRAWVNALLDLRSNDCIRGPSPLAVTYAQDQQLAFTRGQGGEYFTLLNFSNWSGWKSLAELNLPHHTYRELWNSSWPAFAVEDEDEHTNGGRDARLDRSCWLHVPEYGAVILERALP